VWRPGLGRSAPGGRIRLLPVGDVPQGEGPHGGLVVRPPHWGHEDSTVSFPDTIM
jgi:hypothetical protein